MVLKAPLCYNESKDSITGKECKETMNREFNINGDCKPELHYMVESLFIKNGCLDMDMVIRKYVETFDDLYRDQNQKFDEAAPTGNRATNS